VAAALGGAVLMLLIGATDAEHAFYSEDSGIDWNVIFLLLGMMLIVSVLKRTGAFEYLAIWSVKRARGRPFPVMVILVVVTAVASAVLDNVTTVLLIAPVTFLVCDRLAVPVAPFLIAEVMASNIGGTATLVGDPPNIIIGSRGGLTYNDFLVHLTPLIVVLVVVFVGLCRVLFRSAFEVMNRDMYLLTSRDLGKHFDGKRIDRWDVGVCVMSTQAFAEGVSGMFTAWETKGQIYMARVDAASGSVSQVVAAPGDDRTRKHPALAVGDDGTVLLAWTEETAWNKGGAAAWQLFSADGRPIGETDRAGGVPVWGLVAAYSRPGGGFALTY